MSQDPNRPEGSNDHADGITGGVRRPQFLRKGSGKRAIFQNEIKAGSPVFVVPPANREAAPRPAVQRSNQRSQDTAADVPVEVAVPKRPRPAEQQRTVESHSNDEERQRQQQAVEAFEEIERQVHLETTGGLRRPSHVAWAGNEAESSLVQERNADQHHPPFDHAQPIAARFDDDEAWGDLGDNEQPDSARPPRLSTAQPRMQPPQRPGEAKRAVAPPRSPPRVRTAPSFAAPAPPAAAQQQSRQQEQFDDPLADVEDDGGNGGSVDGASEVEHAHLQSEDADQLPPDHEQLYDQDAVPVSVAAAPPPRRPVTAADGRAEMFPRLNRPYALPESHLPQQQQQQPPPVSSVVKRYFGNPDATAQQQQQQQDSKQPAYVRTKGRKRVVPPHMQQQQQKSTGANRTSNAPAAATGKVGAGQAAPAAPAVNDAVVAAKIKQLDDEIAKFQEQTRELKKRRAELDRELAFVKGDSASLKQRLSEREEEFERFKAAEQKKLDKQRMEVEKQLRRVSGLPERKDRDLINQLQEELAALKRELKEKEAKWSVARDRMQASIASLQTRNKQLTEDIKFAEQARIAEWEEKEKTWKELYAGKGAKKRSAGSASQPNSPLRDKKASSSAAATAATSTAGNEFFIPNRGGSGLSASTKAASTSQAASAKQLSQSTGAGAKCKASGSLKGGARKDGSASLGASAARPATATAPSKASTSAAGKTAAAPKAAAQATNDGAITGPASSGWDDEDEAQEDGDQVQVQVVRSPQRKRARDRDQPAQQQHQPPPPSHDSEAAEAAGDEELLVFDQSLQMEPEDDHAHAASDSAADSKRSSTAAPAAAASGAIRTLSSVLKESSDTRRSDAAELDERDLVRTLQHAGGKSEKQYSDGTVVLFFRNGTSKRIAPSGYTRVDFPNRDKKETFPDGRVVYFYASADTTHITYPNGLQVYHFSDQQKEMHHPDGSKEIVFADGTLKKIAANGVEQTVLPAANATL